MSTGSQPTSFRRATAWSFATTGGQQGFTAVFTLVLAALLGPEVFGLVAMAMVYVSFVQLVLEQGMAAAIIQRKQLRDAHLDAAFWLVVASAAALTLVSVLLAGAWARANRTPELGPVIIALSGTVPLLALSIVPQAILQRGMNFRALAVRANLSVLGGGAVGVSLAIAGYGIWALVVQQLVTVSLGVLVLWFLCSWRPSFRFDGSAARDLLGFSAGTLVGKVGYFINERSDTLVMGLFFGPAAVGLYRIADRLMRLFVDLAAMSIRAVALPEFSRMQDDRARIAESFVRCIRLAATLSFPPLALLAAGSAEAMVVLGEKWVPAAGPLTLLCAAGVIRTLTLFTGPVMQALGRPHALAALIWAHGVPSGLVFLAGGVWLQDAPTDQQTIGIAASRLVLFLLVFLPVHSLVIRRLLPIRLGQIARAILPACLAAGVGSLGVWAIRASGWVGGLPELGTALLTIVPPGLVTALLLLGLDPELKKLVLELRQRATQALERPNESA